ncbi:MAG: hypothetical protein P8Z70_08420, partial [Desulfuromonadales bacterium]
FIIVPSPFGTKKQKTVRRQFCNPDGPHFFRISFHKIICPSRLAEPNHTFTFRLTVCQVMQGIFPYILPLEMLTYFWTLIRFFTFFWRRPNMKTWKFNHFCRHKDKSRATREIIPGGSAILEGKTHRLPASFMRRICLFEGRLHFYMVDCL